MRITERRNNKVVGFITWRRVGKLKHKLFELTRIEVSPEYRRKGVATKLFKLMLEKMEFRKLFLTTHASNLESQKFYEEMGMEYETTLKTHYYFDEDEYVYTMYKKGG